MAMLCTLSDVKTLLGISLDDLSKDSILTLLIKQASADIEGYLGYTLSMSEYIDEVHCANYRQIIQLNHFPLRSVSSVTANGVEITDYKILPEYARWGNLYRGYGWGSGAYLRGFTNDVVAGMWNIEVTYTAGYYLPGDTGYTEGAENSLPYDISAVCMRLVEQAYLYKTSGAVGLKAHSEGHISDTYGDNASAIGLSEDAKKALARYVLVGLA
jgi:hypothetical protein